jgi:hypothetical protein
MYPIILHHTGLARRELMESLLQLVLLDSYVVECSITCFHSIATVVRDTHLLPFFISL